MNRTDDVEKQMRRHFFLPSYSLDYFSKELGIGGKISMAFSDWDAICKLRTIQITRLNDTGCGFLFDEPCGILKERGEKALSKMIKYGKKDTADTDKLRRHIMKYAKSKFNFSAFEGRPLCSKCGSAKIHKNGVRLVGNTKKQRWGCSSCGGHAGYSTITKSGKCNKLTQ
jgi:hypothetical protein